MNLIEVRDFLKKNIIEESEKYYGFTNPDILEQITRNWFNDYENYDGRWKIIADRTNNIGKVLDMAAGCGTFVLNGLQNGYDIYGIEPEEWKRDYFRKKISASNYPNEWNDRIISGFGEALPFDDKSFDLITTYQTIEHVQDVKSCIEEMLRVLKNQGVLYIKAPDYNCFFEPHYRVPFLPKMNKRIAALYLKIIGRPILGLSTLQWVTEKHIINLLNECKYNLIIKLPKEFYLENRKYRISELLPSPIKKNYIVNFLSNIYGLKSHILNFLMIGRREKNIDLWITKLD